MVRRPGSGNNIISEHEFSALLKDADPVQLEELRRRYTFTLLVHLTRATWQAWQRSPQKDNLLAQVIIHELAEGIMESPEGISPHQFAVILRCSS